MNPIDQFKSAMLNAGLIPPDTIEPGRIHRFPGADKGRGNTAGRCFMFTDLRGGWYEDYSNGGEQINWQATGSKPYTQAERMANTERSKAANDAYRAEKERGHAVAAEEAEARFKAATPCTQHPYLTAKGVQSHKLKVEADGTLLVPMRDDGKLWNVERINPNDFKDKRGLNGGRRKGLYHVIGDKPVDTLLIGSGYSTSATCCAATGITTVVAFNDSNIPTVAVAMRLKFPDLKIIICGDDDYQNAVNSGRKYATEAATAVGGYLAMPDFGDNRPEKATDFNDLQQIAGLDAVKRCIESAIPFVSAHESSTKDSGESDEVISDTHRNAPRPDPACLYGLVRDVALAGSNNTEANPYAIAAAMLAYLGAAFGRGPFMPIGDDWNHARLFMVHVGRSSRGRKGTAKKLIYRINNAVKEIDESLVPQVHRGGLSTREGLALMIHDGYKDGKNEVPAITDKRLLVVESEFANILHQSKRDGNTLSAALRDAWDGTSIRPAVKTCRVWASDPHIGIIGDVTPSELRELMRARELTNGFANRFIFFWAEGDKVLPFPKYTPKNVVEGLAAQVAQVLRFAGADRHVDMDVMPMEFSPEAASLYARLYRGELRDRSAGEHITGLLDRRAPVLLRLAMLFALTDQTNVIAVAHIHAGMAWVRYWVDSVKFIFQSAVDEAGAEVVNETARKIVAYLTEKGQCTRTELSKGCFGGHVSKDKLDKALDELITASPPTIEVATVPRTNGQSGSASKVYKVCPPSATGFNAITATQAADSANSAEREAPSALPAWIAPMRSQRNVESDERDGLPEFAQVAAFADANTTAPTRMDIDTLQNSQSSQRQQNDADDVVEVF